MFIDALFTILMVIALLQGLRKGFVVAVFSMLAFFIGLAAALKLSAFVAQELEKNTQISGRWLPAVSFFLVFIVIVMLVRIGARWIDKTVRLVWLGWINRLLGVILYAVIYTVIFSIFLFYAVQLHVVKEKTINESVLYGFIQPWGPYVIGSLGKLIPWFRDLFGQLENFFGNFTKTS